MHTLFSLLKNEQGATAVEYSLIVGLVAVVLVVALSSAGSQLSGVFGDLSGVLDDANNG